MTRIKQFEKEHQKLLSHLQQCVRQMSDPKEAHLLPHIRLGASDYAMEEILLMEEYGYMPSEADTIRYFEARNRALERATDQNQFMQECLDGFRAGLLFTIQDRRTVQEQLPPRIFTETNYGFGFICGVLARLEAVKGKSYLGSWQKRGEPVVLANLQRKFDRLDALIGAEKAESGENLTQTTGDLAVYAIKWITLRAEIDPDEFLNWILEVQHL